MPEIVQQTSEGWVDPVTRARISVYEITWLRTGAPQHLQAGGGLYFWQEPEAGDVLRRHDFPEIVLMHTGSVIHKVNGERQQLTPGSLVFLRPGDVHCLPDGQSRKAEFVQLDFDLELFLSLSVYLENDAFLHQLTAPVLPPRFQLEPNAANALYVRLLRLNSPAVSPLLRKIKLKILLGELFAQFFIDEANLLSEAHVPDWLGRLCAEMRREENFVGGIARMRKLAFHAPGHLCKTFQKYLGKTPTEFVNELKLAYAARVLADTRQKIEELSPRHLQFGSLSHFYHLFKKYYGISPLEYRNRHADTTEN